MPDLRPKKGRFLIYYQECSQCRLENTWLAGQPDYDTCRRCKAPLDDDAWEKRYESSVSKERWLAHQWDDLKQEPKKGKKGKVKSEEPKEEPPAEQKREQREHAGLTLNSPAEDVLNRVTNWISSRAHLNEDERERLGELIAQSQDKMNVFLTVVGQHQARRLTKLLSIVDALEDELFTVDRLADASTKELLRMLQSATAAITSALSMVKAADRRDVVDVDKLLAAVRGESKDQPRKVKAEIDLPLNERKSLRRVLETLTHSAAVRLIDSGGNDGEEDEDEEDD